MKLKKKKNTDHDDSNMYVTTQESKLTSQSFAAILAEVNLATKNDIANFVKKRHILMTN